MLITECGTADRVLAETKDHLNLMGSCVMCKHMKRLSLKTYFSTPRPLSRTDS